MQMQAGQWQQHLFTLQVTAIDISQSGCYQPVISKSTFVLCWDKY